MENQHIQTEDFQIFDLWDKCIRHWWWFLISLAICAAFATLYIWVTPKSYMQTSQVMINDDKKSSEMPVIFGNQGITWNLSVKNEVEMFKSPIIVKNVVRKLNLTTNYSIKKNMRAEDMYSNTPVKASFPGTSESAYFSFQLEFTPDSSFILSKFKRGDKKVNQEPIRGIFRDTITTSIGKVVILPTRFYGTNWYFIPMEISKLSVSTATKSYGGKLVTALVSKDNSIIRLELTDTDIPRAADFLNELLIAYNENWLLEKNKTALVTSKFLSEQLPLYEQELRELELNIEQFKSQHKLTKVGMTGEHVLTLSSEYSKQIVDVNTRLTVAKWIKKDFLSDSSNEYSLLPFNSGLGNSNIEAQIGEHNKLVQERDKYIGNSDENNPAIIDLNSKLNSMRRTIGISIDAQIQALTTQLSGFQEQEVKLTRQITSNPGQERVLMSMERDFKLKEEAYNSLLQRKIENDMSLIISPTNTQLIRPPTGSSTPVKPKNKLAIMVALVLGIGIPGGIVMGLENLNIKVRDKKDLSVLSIPLLGVISLANKTEQKDGYLLVQENGSDAINETFRMVRTNLDSQFAKEKKVVMFTSLEPGSGKTFTSLNLAMSLALAGKKVVLLDIDMRTAALSNLISLPEIGIENFLNGKISSEQFIVLKNFFYPGFDVIPVGVIPPNPTELLMSDRFKVLIERLRSSYDYVFLDSTPLDMVADATIVAKHTDVTVFVVRANHTDRRRFPVLEETYKRGHFKEMVLILNGAEQEIYFNKHHTEYHKKIRDIALLPQTAYTTGKTKYLPDYKNTVSNHLSLPNE